MAETAQPGHQGSNQAPPHLPLIALDELVARGYLHEANRLFFHPLGLALTVNRETGANVWQGMGVQDGRADVEGCVFDTLEPAKMQAVAEEQARRRPAREARLGFWVQDRDCPVDPSQAGDRVE